MQFKKALWLHKSAHMYTKFHLLPGPNFIHDIPQTFVNMCKNECLKLYNTCYISQHQMYSSRTPCLIHQQMVCYGKCGGIAPRYLSLSTV
jgi:hypothetical protein